MEKGTCLNCGNVFYKARRDKVFCSVACKSENWRLTSKDSTEEPKKIPARRIQFIRRQTNLGNANTDNKFEIIGRKTSYIDDLREERKKALDALYACLNENFNNKQLNKTLICSGAGALAGHALTNDKQEKNKHAFLGGILGGLLSVLTAETKQDWEKNRYNKLRALDFRLAELDRMITSEELGIKHLQKIDLADLVPVEVMPDFKPEKEKVIASLPIIKPDLSNIEVLPKTLTAQELVNQEYETIHNFPANWIKYFGKPSYGFHAIIYGMPGAGKSTESIKLAGDLANSGHKVLYISSEEGFSPTLKSKVLALAKRSENLRFSECNDKTKLIMLIKGNLSPFIVLDSINHLDISPAELEALRSEFKPQKVAFIGICQTTKEGNPRGSNEYIHNADIILKVELDHTIKTEKNRYELEAKR